jgi:RHS repeat-associated protein
VIPLLTTTPQAKSPRASKARVRVLNPQQPQSQQPQEPQRQRKRQAAPHDSGKKVDSVPTPPAVSLANVPTVNEVRQHKSDKPKAPDPIPSTKRAPRKEVKDKPKDKKAEIKTGILNDSVELLGSARANYLRNFNKFSLSSVLGVGSYARRGGSPIAFATGFHWLKSFDSVADKSVRDMSFDLLAPPLPQAGSSKIVFASNREGSMQIYVMHGDGSGVTRLTYSGANDDYPRWSPNGAKILFQSDRDHPDTGYNDIYVMNSDGSGVTRLTTDAGDDSMASWSPDGSKIVFQSFGNGSNYRLYSMNADGSSPVSLTNTGSNDIEAFWSPNGAKIAFASDRDHAGSSSVYVMNSNGSGQQRLTFSAATFEDRQPAWSRDGAKIAFVSTRDSVIETWTDTDDYEIPEDDGQTFPRSLLHINKEVYLMNADGSGQTRLTNELANDESPSWSPDGTKIIFRSDRERDGSDPTAQLWTMNADGSGLTNISNSGNGDYVASWNSGSFNQNPVANAGGSYSGVTAQSVSFNGGGSSDPDGTIVSYSWNFGDGGTGSGATPTHAYAANGNYTVTLTVTDNAGAQASAQTTANIAGASSSEIATALLDPFNQPGSQLQARDCEWSVPLVSLPGRAGLDLGLTLSYSSMVWTRVGSLMYFDADSGDPSPGFRLGFPTLGNVFYNSQATVNARMMVTSSGRRVEFRYAGHYGSYDLYETGDSSYAQLLDYGGSIWLRTTDGTNLNFISSGGEWHCITIRDRNGNTINATYTNGDLATVTDTLGRVLYFNYDTFGNLNSISQNWNGWWRELATFGWSNVTLHPNFALTPVGASEGQSFPMLTQVGLIDGSHYNFDYTDRGQVNKIHRYTADGAPGIAGDIERSYLAYVYEPATDDCPRVSTSSIWAENWSDVNNVPHEVVTTFADLGSGWHQVTTPDGTQYRQLYGVSGWQRGLLARSEVWPQGANASQKTTTINYTQDNTGVSYQTNPRVIETIIDDAGGNHRRTTIDYSPSQYAQFGLPYFVSEYANDGITELRRTYTDYNLSQQYLDWHIIGLVSAVHVVDLSNGWQWNSKTTYNYDEASVDSQATTATQHDQYFSSSFNVRGNLTSASRWDVTDITNGAKAHTTQVRYNAAGSMLSSTDPIPGHQIAVSYGDSFSDGNNGRGTYAYPTTVTDPDGFQSFAQYNFDFGAVTRTQNPLGAVQTISYDDAIRLQRVTTVTTGAYTRYDYGSNYSVTNATINNVADDAFTVAVFDGLGRAFETFASNPNSSGSYQRQIAYRDAMGRVTMQSNPTEVDGAWNPAGDDAGPWVWTQQTYDWKGRPLRTIHPDSYYTELSYTGCGCAGGEIVTAADEVGRRKRTTSDVLGRMIKAEELNWDGSVYSTANYSYNALDQVKSIAHEGQTRSFDYDGYGRLHVRTTPEQGATTYEYNADDTLHMVTDARSVTATYGYNNNRHLVNSINYDESGDPMQQTGYTPPVSFGYDAAGNRTSMTDAAGTATYHYDQLSRMDWEERTFGVLGPYRLSYTYNVANELASITGPSQFGSVQVGYNYDTNGRLRNVTGSGYGGASTYASDITYRAFGAIKGMNFQDSHSLSTSYDNRMRVTSWDVANVLGFSYTYYGGNSFGGANQVNYARNLSSNGGRDESLDRSYEYDQVGALVFAHSGAEARAAFGIDGTPWGNSNGPYSHWYDYDKHGNMDFRFGWGGEVQGGAPYGGDTMLTYNYANNKLTNLGYDAAGNVTYDGYANTYNVSNQQTMAESGSYILAQTYDGDGLRAIKYDNGPTTLYLRSSVLGGAVVDEIDANHNLARGYVYAGSDLLAVQSGGQVSWVHADPFTKSQRVTDISGSVINTVELDPWGANTNRSSASPFQPQNFTTYIRDGNGQQDAMARRYSVNGRFSQPDPYGGSYNLGDPQSMNRYSYTKNDPVNFRDPSGLGIKSILRAIGRWLSRESDGAGGGGPSYDIGGMAVVEDEDGGEPQLPGLKGGASGSATPCAAQDFAFGQGANGLTAQELSEISQAAVGESSRTFSAGETSAVIDTIENRLSSNLWGAANNWVVRDSQDGKTYDMTNFSKRAQTAVGILGEYQAYWDRRTRSDGLRSGEGKVADAKRLNNGVIPAGSDVCNQLLEARANAGRVGDAISSPGTFVNQGVNSNLGLGVSAPSNFNLLFTIGNTRFGRRPYLTPRP